MLLVRNAPLHGSAVWVIRKKEKHMSNLISKLPPAVSTDSSKIVSEVQAFEPTAARCSCTTLPCCCCCGG
ncbi:hypothetical protein DN545_38440 [Burkholderia multivorans]|nr:hypothetical protein DN508_31690 [Burkholderia multivorans]RAE96299.1 hypothetical protein DN545_38440 [Burkholderia multivorans]